MRALSQTSQVPPFLLVSLPTFLRLLLTIRSPPSFRLLFPLSFTTRRQTSLPPPPDHIQSLRFRTGKKRKSLFFAEILFIHPTPKKALNSSNSIISVCRYSHQHEVRCCRCRCCFELPGWPCFGPGGGFGQASSVCG